MLMDFSTQRRMKTRTMMTMLTKKKNTTKKTIQTKRMTLKILKMRIMGRKTQISLKMIDKNKLSPMEGLVIQTLNSVLN